MFLKTKQGGDGRGRGGEHRRFLSRFRGGHEGAGGAGEGRVDFHLHLVNIFTSPKALRFGGMYE